MIELARANSPSGNIRFVEGDAYALPSLVAEPVDRIVATSAWQNFLLDKKRIIAAISSELKPSGHFAFDVRLRETIGGESPPGQGMMRFRQRVITVLRDQGVDVNEQSQFERFGGRASDWQPYRREDIDRDLESMRASGFRIRHREEVTGGPFGGERYKRQRWRMEYWLARAAPGLPAERRTAVLNKIAEEAQGRSESQQQVTTVYIVVEMSS